MYSINVSIVGVGMGSFDFFEKFLFCLVKDEKNLKTNDRFENRIFHDVFTNI